MKTLRATLMCLLLVGCAEVPTAGPASDTNAGQTSSMTETPETSTPLASQAPLRRQTTPTSEASEPATDPTPRPTATPRPRSTPLPTPTPRPSTAATATPTPAPSATSTATPTPKPSATPTPAPTVNTTSSVTLSGTGPGKTSSFALAQGKVAFQLNHTGNANFVVWLVNGNGRRFILLANKLGNYSGTTTVNIEHAGNFSLEVELGTSWSVSVGPG